MILPRPSDFKKLRFGLYLADLLLVLVFLISVVAAITAFSGSWQEAGVNLLCGVVLPFAIWNWLMAFVTIQHHTHPQAPWFKDPEEWSFFEAQVHGTIHLRLPRWIELVFHNILDHTAHHVDPKIPLYNLTRSQEHLEARYPEDILIMQGSVPALQRVLKVCKLYDYDRHCWLDFNGTPSAPPVLLYRNRMGEESIALQA